MRRAAYLLGRLFSGRGKSRIRTATEMSIFLAALALVLYGAHGVATSRLILDAALMALLGFILGLLIGTYNERQRKRG